MSLDYSDIYIPDCWVFRRNDRGDFNGVSEAFLPRKLSITCEHWTQISNTPLFSYHDHPGEPRVIFDLLRLQIPFSFPKRIFRFSKLLCLQTPSRDFWPYSIVFSTTTPRATFDLLGFANDIILPFLFDFAFCRRESVLNVQSFILIVLDVAKVTSWHLWSISTERVFTVTGRLFMLGCSV